MPRHKQSFVNLRVDAGEEITIGETRFAFDTHPLTKQAYVQAGARGWIYKLKHVESGRPYALKVFAHMNRDDRILRTQEALQEVAHLPGMETGRRVLLSAETHPVLVIEYPAADRSMLMPWVEGVTWQDIVVEGEEASLVFSKEQCQTLALDVALVLAELERNHFAHCDVAGANLIVQPKRGVTFFVDIEEMYGGNFPVPPVYPAGQTGYRHRSVENIPTGQWGPSGDRFAGAVLISEILAWHDSKIRKVRDAISYFDDADPGKPEAWRLELLVESLKAHYHEEIAWLLEEAWESDFLEGCPPMANWEAVLKTAIPLELHPPRLKDGPLAEGPDIEPLPALLVNMGVEREPDDLKRIYGITGREVAVLRALKVETFSQLAGADPIELQENLAGSGLQVDGETILAWIGDARALLGDGQE